MTSMELLEEFQSFGTVQLLPDVRKITTACAGEAVSQAMDVTTKAAPNERMTYLTFGVSWAAIEVVVQEQ
jgi:hypothetical protein